MSSPQEAAPRLLNRKNAAAYMGLSLRKFDEMKHLFRVEVLGVSRYDRVLMDRHIELSHAA